MKHSVTLFAFLITLILFVSCRKSYDGYGDDGIIINKMTDLKVSPNFNFSSLKEITVDVILPYTVDYTLIKGRLDFYYLDAGFNEVIVQTVLTDNQGRFSGKLKVPGFLEGIYVRNLSGDYYIPFDNSLKATMEGGVINFGSYIDTIPPRDSLSLKSAQTAAIEAPIHNSRKPKLATTSNNLLENGDFTINDFGSISSWDSPMTVDGRWYETSYLANKISRVALAGEHVLKMAPYNNLNYGGVAQLIEASAGELLTFSIDSKSTNGNGVAWIYLIPRNSWGQSLDFFSRYIPQVSTNWTTYTISATMPAGTVSCQALIWNEFYSNRTVYFDKASVIGPAADDDNDGVTNEEDEYPNDPQRAYNLWYPDNTQFGTLAFEDNWPHTADYDLNDLVVGYRFKQVLNANTSLVEVFADFSIKAIGASYRNAFGFMMNIPAWSIQSVTGSSLTTGFIQTAANGTEAGQSQAVIFVTDDPKVQLPYPGSGEFVNTTPGSPYVEPDTMHLHIALQVPVSLSSIGYAPYNPFIVVNRNRGREIHLTDQLPTAFADNSFFGTVNDNSNPATGRYYKTSENLPWALDIPGPFDYPAENNEIIKGYLKFAPWAMSSGAEYSDWYLPNIAGYRDNTFIY